MNLNINSKSEIRDLYIQNRLLLKKDQVQEKSNIIADNFIKNFASKINDFSQKKLAFYCPINNEVDPIFIANFYQKIGNIISFPRITPNSKILEFREGDAKSKFISNVKYKKILEPDHVSKLVVPDIVFVPLVAFDKGLYRVGMGGGFYDSTIKHYRSQNLGTKFIGLGYDDQLCMNFSHDSWDQKLDFLVSQTYFL